MNIVVNIKPLYLYTHKINILPELNVWRHCTTAQCFIRILITQQERIRNWYPDRKCQYWLAVLFGEARTVYTIVIFLPECTEWARKIRPLCGYINFAELARQKYDTFVVTPGDKTVGECDIFWGELWQSETKRNYCLLQVGPIKLIISPFHNKQIVYQNEWWIQTKT